jgi:hypothetical protein
MRTSIRSTANGSRPGGTKSGNPPEGLSNPGSHGTVAVVGDDFDPGVLLRADDPQKPIVGSRWPPLRRARPLTSDRHREAVGQDRQPLADGVEAGVGERVVLVILRRVNAAF